MKKFPAINNSVLLAGTVFLAIVVWLLSGQFRNEKQGVAHESQRTPRETTTMVRVRQLTPRKIRQEIVINGRTEPARAVTLRAEGEGQVVALEVEEGSEVEKGDVIARLDTQDLRARLNEAKATLEQRRLEYQGAEELQRKDLQSKIQLERAKATLISAQSLVTRIEVAISKTIIRAPFKGVLERLPIEIGGFVQAGDTIARILEQDPILIVGSVTQQDRNRLVLGDPGIARLITGQVAEGKIRYIATEADDATRTFRVELELSNPDRAIVAGLTTEISIPVRSVTAYRLSPALISLSGSDELGVKAVTEEDLVQFYPVRIVRSTIDDLWVTGLPDDVRVITVGQGFVRPGERVRAVLDNGETAKVGAGDGSKVR